MISVELMYIETGTDLINLVALLPQSCMFQAVSPRLCGQWSGEFQNRRVCWGDNVAVKLRWDEHDNAV